MKNFYLFIWGGGGGGQVVRMKFGFSQKLDFIEPCYIFVCQCMALTYSQLKQSMCFWARQLTLTVPI